MGMLIQLITRNHKRNVVTKANSSQYANCPYIQRELALADEYSILGTMYSLLLGFPLGLNCCRSCTPKPRCSPGWSSLSLSSNPCLYFFWRVGKNYYSDYYLAEEACFEKFCYKKSSLVNRKHHGPFIFKITGILL